MFFVCVILVNFAFKRCQTYVAESSESVTDVPHRVVGEGDEWVVRGEGVPPGGEGGLSQPVPEHSHPLPLSPEHIKTQRKTNDKVPLCRWHIWLNMWQNFRFHSSCCHHINNTTHCFLQTQFMFCFPVRIMHKTLNINAFFASGHIQNSYNL